MKQISYIYAENHLASGELKHGPLPSVDEGMPVIGVGPNDSSMDKLQSNLGEVAPRDGELSAIAFANLHEEADDRSD